uniref:Uncharacterized protein n=1 Tax=Denticeps clupeoides TaxID=299321 RepID=A0AAY4C4B5_9TELE
MTPSPCPEEKHALKRVIVTPAVYPRFIEFLHFDIQSTGQKSHRVNTRRGPSRCFVLIKQSDSPGPQSLSRSYGSDLPTSLTYIVPTCQRLFTLETCCGYGYGPARDLHPLPRIFTDQRELTGRRRNRGAFQGTGPYLGANPFQGALPFTKKRELFPGPPPASPGSFALPHWTPRGADLRHSGFGDLNPTPFRSAGGDGGHRPTLPNGVRPSLRTD